MQTMFSGLTDSDLSQGLRELGSRAFVEAMAFRSQPSRARCCTLERTGASSGKSGQSIHRMLVQWFLLLVFFSFLFFH